MPPRRPLLAQWAGLIWQRHRVARGINLLLVYVAQDVAMAPRRVLAAARTALRRRPVETLVFLVILAAGMTLRPHTLPLLMGTACIPAGYALGRAIGGPGVAVITAALIAGAPILNDLGTVLAFFTLLLLWAGSHAIRAGAPQAWALAIAATVCGMLVSPAMIVPATAAFVWFACLALTRPPARRKRGCAELALAAIGACAATLFLGLPVMVIDGWRVVVPTPALPGFAANLMHAWSIQNEPGTAGLIIALAAAALLLARRSRTLYAGLIIGIATAIVVPATGVIDANAGRQALLPVLMLLAAATLDGIAGRIAKPLPGVLALLLLIGMALTGR